MNSCYHCGEPTVVWDADFEFSDFGYNGSGLIHTLHCNNCGAEIEYKIPIKKEGEKNGNEVHG